MPKSKNYWLVKTEPSSFSIQDLAASPRRTTCWDGVRNYLARNHMRAMQLGDEVLFYHSNADPLAIVGVTVVVRQAYPDPTAWDSANHHHDAKASPVNPIWDMVDLRLEEIFPAPLPLDELRKEAGLAKMELLRRGSRLSVQPVTEAEFRVIEELAHAETAQPQDERHAAKNKPPEPGGKKPRRRVKVKRAGTK
jgi:predicted RNA-binding protein with PUA-like domain